MNQHFELQTHHSGQPTVEDLPRIAGEVAAAAAGVELQDGVHPAEENKNIILGYN